MTESTGANMKDEEAKTAFIAGYEIDTDIAEQLLNETLPSVKRVVEEMIIAGRDSESVKAAANATALAITEAVISLFRSHGTAI